MAVNKTINKRTNTHGAMRNCIEYVLRRDKTSEVFTYVTGPHCHDEINYDLVYRTFLEEKKMWDKDHIHCHLVTNSVRYEDGRKLHNTKQDLERMKKLTNQMCRERGLSVAEKGNYFDGSQIEKGRSLHGVRTNIICSASR